MNKKILLLYPNSTNDGVMPLAIGILSTIAKDLGCDVEYFETSFYQKEGSVPEERERTGEFKASDRKNSIALLPHDRLKKDFFEKKFQYRCHFFTHLLNGDFIDKDYFIENFMK